MKRNPDQQRLMLQLKRDVHKLTEPGLHMLHELEAMDPPDPCTKPPKGWRCTRDADHEGPCAAVEDEEKVPDTVRSERLPAPVVELKREASPGLIKTLEGLLDEARSGKVIGVTFLCNLGWATRVYFAGTREQGAELIAFEDYKFRNLIERNVEKPPPMVDQDK